MLTKGHFLNSSHVLTLELYVLHNLLNNRVCRLHATALTSLINLFQLDENFSMDGQYQQRNVLTFFWIFFLHLMHLFIGSAQALHTSLCPQGVNTMTLSACSHFIQRSCFFNIWFSSSMTSGSTSVNN